VTCDDFVTVPVDSASFSQTSHTTVDQEARFGGSRTSDGEPKRKPPRGGREKEKTVTLSEAAVWHVTARGSTFASDGSPADVVNNLKALATIAQSYPGSVCASGARAVAQAAYARAVEWSDFELESALRALDRLVAFVKKEETYLVDPTSGALFFFGSGGRRRVRLRDGDERRNRNRRKTVREEEEAAEEKEDSRCFSFSLLLLSTVP
jgi:hypothetical protein